MSAIGDTVLTLPVACALKRHFPSAFVGWVVEEKSAAIVADHPCVDKVFQLPRGWFASRSKRRSLQDQLRHYEFAVSIDCQGNTKSSLACWLSNAQRRLGCRGRYGTEFSPFLNNQLVKTKQPHLTDRSLELLAPLGIRSPHVEWQIARNELVERTITRTVQRLMLPPDFAIINPGATWASKRWEMERFAGVARHLSREHNIPSLIVWGTPLELAMANQIASSARGCTVLAPPSSLVELIAILRMGRVFVSADTGPLHMSVALGTPSIGLYGATHIEACGPYGSPHIGIQERFHGGSRRRRRRASNSAMRMISVSQVCDACDRLLSNQRGRQLVRQRNVLVSQRAAGSYGPA